MDYRIAPFIWFSWPIGIPPQRGDVIAIKVGEMVNILMKRVIGLPLKKSP